MCLEDVRVFFSSLHLLFDALKCALNAIKIYHSYTFTFNYINSTLTRHLLRAAYLFPIQYFLNLQSQLYGNEQFLPALHCVMG